MCSQCEQLVQCSVNVINIDTGFNETKTKIVEVHPSKASYMYLLTVMLVGYLLNMVTFMINYD